MEKETVRTGIVGAGFAASFHFEALQKVHGTIIDVKGVYAIDAEQAAAEGGYEASNALFGPDSGRRLVAKSLEMLDALQS